MSHITTQELALWQAHGLSFELLDVRRAGVRAEHGAQIDGARWLDPAAWLDWKDAIDSKRPVVLYCAKGHEIGQGLTAALRALGVDARYLVGGMQGWLTDGRAVRGLEVFRQTGKKLSALHDAHGHRAPRVPHVAFWLDRSDLPARIEARVGQMMADGYLEEVRRLLAAGVPRHDKAMSSLGYRHLAEHLLDGLPLAEAVARTVRDTRTFARKQRTWLRSLGWPRVLLDGPDPLPAALTAGVTDRA